MPTFFRLPLLFRALLSIEEANDLRWVEDLCLLELPAWLQLLTLLPLACVLLFFLCLTEADLGASELWLILLTLVLYLLAVIFLVDSLKETLDLLFEFKVLLFERNLAMLTYVPGYPGILFRVGRS